jgi:SAM-dependent methyltransferase
MSHIQSDYRALIYDSYLSSNGEAAPDVVAAHIQVRRSHCQRIIQDYFPAQRDARILELGCGYGDLLHNAAAAGYRGMSGVDKSPEQVAAARRFGVGGVIEGDCIEFLHSVVDQDFDAVVSLDLIEHFTKSELCEMAGEVARVLNPRGRWILHTPNGESPFAGRIRYGDFTHEQCFTQWSLRQLFRAYGFNRVECFEDGPVVHGLKSGLRLALWRAIRSGLRAWLVIETGQVGESPIFTQNLFCIAYK